MKIKISPVFICILILFLISFPVKSSVWIVLFDSTSSGKIDTVQHFLYLKKIKKYEIQNIETKKIHYDARLIKVPFTSLSYTYKMKGKGYSPKNGFKNPVQFELQSNNPKTEIDLSNCGGGLDFILVITRKTKWYKKAEKMIIRMDLIDKQYKLNIVFKSGIYFFSQLVDIKGYTYQHPYDLTPKDWDEFKINKEQLYKVSRKYVTNPFEKE